VANKSILIRILNEDISNFHHWRETTKSFTDLTGIQVELEYQWLNDYWATIISAYTDRAGEFDVVATDEMLLPLYARQGAVLPLDEFIKRDSFDLTPFSPAALACATVDDKLYKRPFFILLVIFISTWFRLDTQE
jgi:ABC-type glycerol-3-phosphate transport system substrate-binding protein